MLHPDGPLPAGDRLCSGSRQISAHPELLSRDHTPDCPPGHTFDSGQARNSPGQSRACALVTPGRTVPVPRVQRRSKEGRKERSRHFCPERSEDEETND